MTYKKRNESIADSSISAILNHLECIAAHRRIRLYYLVKAASWGDEDANANIDIRCCVTDII